MAGILKRFQVLEFVGDYVQNVDEALHRSSGEIHTRKQTSDRWQRRIAVGQRRSNYNIASFCDHRDKELQRIQQYRKDSHVVCCCS